VSGEAGSGGARPSGFRLSGASPKMRGRRSTANRTAPDGRATARPRRSLPGFRLEGRPTPSPRLETPGKGTSRASFAASLPTVPLGVPFWPFPGRSRCLASGSRCMWRPVAAAAGGAAAAGVRRRQACGRTQKGNGTPGRRQNLYHAPRSKRSGTPKLPPARRLWHFGLSTWLAKECEKKLLVGVDIALYVAL
jgi:hypothetical protein